MSTEPKAPKILFVSQNADAESILGSRLKNYPHSLVITGFASELLAAKTIADFDLIVIDWYQGTETARQICSSLGSETAVRMMPVVVLTENDEDKTDAAKTGVSVFIDRACQPLELIAGLKRAMVKRPIILHIDDDAVVHNLVTTMLDPERYVLIQRTRALEALKFLGSERPDVIICDIEMPDMSGYHVCRHIKQQEELADIPFVICSSKDSGNDMKRGFEAGADDYITKPFSEKELNFLLDSLTAQVKGTRTKKILVVEDTKPIRNLIMRTLRKDGFEVVGTVDGLDALEIAKENHFDLIICDLEMPRMDGRELILELRKLMRYHLTPILILSAHDEKTSRARGLTAGATDYIAKPFAKEKLKLAVDHLLAQSELKRERAAVRHYLSDAAIEMALQQIGRSSDGKRVMRAEYRFMTILFIDIVGFTGLCEKMQAQQVAAMLNSFFDLVVSEIRGQDGLIDKFIGDCVMALFGRGENGAYRAARFALDLINKLPAFNEKTGYDIQVRIGINSGEVLLGDLGSEHSRRDYTVIGDEVNIAQRFEQRAPTNTVLITDSTYNLIGDFAIIETLAPINLKGRKEPLTPHILRNLKELPFSI